MYNKALSHVECTVRKEPYSDELIKMKLPMYDPHELLDFLWSTKRIDVSEAAVRPLACNYHCVLLLATLLMANPREYWEHFRKLSVPWSKEHPAVGDELPIAALRL